MPYIVWIPLLLIFTFVWAFASKQVNMNPNSLWFYLLFFAVPLWGFISRTSQNLFFDGMLYDALIVIGYAVSFIILGMSSSFTFVNWAGLALTIVGILLLKV